MKDLDTLKKVAVLIDADNAQYSKLNNIMSEISVHGHIVVKRAYGDWSSELLKNWKTVLNELAIQPIQQFAYTTGKNSTDASMIIDAMDLLYSDKYDAFVLVSSDSDFTRLASRLRESEKFVIGVGEKKTPISFRNACDDFIIVENIETIIAEPIVVQPTQILETNSSEEISVTEEKSSIAEKNNSDIEYIHEETDSLKDLLIKAWELYKEDDGWANIAATGSFIKRLKPDFDPRTYKATKLPEILENMNLDFEMKKFPGKGKVNIIAYRPVQKK
ncbi:MAG: NYN domain-containing protein [Flavobacteriales bacterium]|nr:NYN domain-containing protein [Flavobacteriales bacterium]